MQSTCQVRSIALALSRWHRGEDANSTETATPSAANFSSSKLLHTAYKNKVEDFGEKALNRVGGWEQRPHAL